MRAPFPLSSSVFLIRAGYLFFDEFQLLTFQKKKIQIKKIWGGPGIRFGEAFVKSISAAPLISYPFIIGVFIINEVSTKSVLSGTEGSHICPLGSGLRGNTPDFK